MNISVAPVRLVFNVESINAICVASNWLYLTGGPSTVVRINLDHPSQVEDIQLPRKHAGSAGYIKYLFADPSGRSLLAVTSRCEHFFYTDSKQEFKHLGKLKGTTTICVGFYNRHSLLLGTKAGTIVEVGIDSSANETYFKRDLKFASTIWRSPRRDAVTSLIVKSANEVIVACGTQILRWFLSKNTGAGAGEPRFQSLVSADPQVLFSSDQDIKHLVQSPDGHTLAACVGKTKIVFCRNADTGAGSGRGAAAAVGRGRGSSRGSGHGAAEWDEYDVTAQTLEHLLVSNYYLLAVVVSQNGASIMPINMFSKQPLELVEIPESGATIRGTAVDAKTGTYWLHSLETLMEIKLENEQSGMWKVLASQERFEEALEIADTPQSRSCVLEMQGRSLLNSDPKRGAELIGLSNAPLEISALDVMKASESALPALLRGRLSHTKSKAQQIMLTSLLAELGDLGFLDTNASWDKTTVLQVLKTRGEFDKYVSVLINSGDIDGAVAFHVANENWSEALDLLRQHEQSESVYKFSTLLLTKAPRQTVESWMRMPSLDVSKLLPALIAYASEYRGNSSENQALRYLLNLLKQFGKQQELGGGTTGSAANSETFQNVYSATVTMLVAQGSDEECYNFLKSYAPYFNNHFFSLRMCVKYKKHRSAVYLYEHQDLYEDAVQICLDIGTPEMIELAIEVANNSTAMESQGGEELRKYLLRKIARQAIETQGPSAATRFIKLLRVDDLLAQFPDFDSLSDLAPEIVKSLEQTNSRLNNLDQEIDATLQASGDMQQELAQFKRKSVLVEPGEVCQICGFPLVTRAFVVFPCQHGFHVDCAERRLKEMGLEHRDVTADCVLCMKENLQQIDAPLESVF